jgi:hypothetical protein
LSPSPSTQRLATKRSLHIRGLSLMASERFRHILFDVTSPFTCPAYPSSHHVDPT